MKQHSLLAIFSHPDDEAFGTGGSISCYSCEGVRVDLICATRGEAGEISDPSLATPETLGEVREEELRCAAETMGVNELIFLGYRDSGMAGSQENNDPRAFINIPQEEVVSRLVRMIRWLKPEVIVTFEPNGGYGHPDHIAIHHHTVNAFYAAADPRQYPEAGKVWQSRRLFYTAIPRSFFQKMRQKMVKHGLDTTELDNLDAGAGSGWPDEKVNVILDVSETVEAKWQALNCHRTQFGPGNLFRKLPEQEVKELMSHEYFALAWPEPEPGYQLSDLLEGL